MSEVLLLDAISRYNQLKAWRYETIKVARTSRVIMDVGEWFLLDAYNGYIVRGWFTIRGLQDFFKEQGVLYDGEYLVEELSVPQDELQLAHA